MATAEKTACVPTWIDDTPRKQPNESWPKVTPSESHVNFRDESGEPIALLNFERKQDCDWCNFSIGGLHYSKPETRMGNAAYDRLKYLRQIVADARQALPQLECLLAREEAYYEEFESEAMRQHRDSKASPSTAKPEDG